MGRAAIAKGRSRRLAGTTALATAGLVALAWPAVAGEREVPPSGEAPAGGEAVVLDPITVEGAAERQDALTSPPGFVATQSSVGSKTDTPIIEVPQSVSVVTRDQLTVRNVQSDAQALLYTPGVWSQPFGSDQNLNNPFFIIRGFQSAFGGSYVDGLVSPVNYRYEPFGIERYDIFRGPSSTLYGQAELGGLVNRVTKRPPGVFSGEVQLQGGTYDRKQAAVDVGGPVDAKGRLLYRLTAVKRDADAAIDYRHGLDAPDERTYVAPAATVNLGPDTSLTLLTNYLDDKVGQELVFRDADGDLTHTALADDDENVFDYEHEMYGYAFEHRFMPGLQLRQNLRYTHMDNERRGYFQGAIDESTSTVERFLDGFKEERRDFAVDTQLQADTRTGPVGHKILAGVDYQRLKDKVAFTTGLATPLDYDDPDYDDGRLSGYTPYISNRFNTRTLGAYAQDQLRLDGWLLTLGTRYDRVRGETEDLLTEGSRTQTKTDHEVTYRAGLGYETKFGLVPYVSYATSFLPTSGTDIEGEAFEPTSGRQYEVGLKYKPPGWNALFAVAAYDLEKEDVVTADPQNGLDAFTQVGKVRSRGIEVEANASLMAGLDLTLAYAYNDAEITEDNADAIGVSREGNDPAQAPKHLASVWLDYTFQGTALRGLLVGGGVRYVGSNYADAENTLKNDDYVLLDAALRYDFGSLDPRLSGASLAVNVNNLLDENYETCTTVVDCNFGVGRTAIATLSYRW